MTKRETGANGIPLLIASRFSLAHDKQSCGILSMVQDNREYVQNRAFSVFPRGVAVCDSFENGAGVVPMELDNILLWFSYISLVFWSVVLVWCVASIIIKQRKEQEWLKHYKPTLQSDISEPDIRSWLTLTQVELTKEELATKRAIRKRSSDPSSR